MTQALTQHELAEGASIDPMAQVEGFVRLGKNSHIGRNVWVKGNLIVGDNTQIDQGVIIEGNVMIGDACTIMNHAKIHGLSCIGSRNMLDQGFEFLGGMSMEHVYMVHYGEFYGLVGENSDLGAGTTSGTLRFDDQSSTHVVKGRKEVPNNFSNSTYLGDYTRTGVAALLMPGVKVGAYSVVGSGVILSEDVADRTLVFVDQKLIKKPWGTDKYGW
jgi:UDP-N-acetylglucosamine diphosphorylase / glucose-1-phosphate thymidylyltransferase / UDP-N-acetylgalactosamine diphosphorylase / glucosamine-1-phosphate N-acetyltransferase / galactosamine-1-phosphate N-acetyltransferase